MAKICILENVISNLVAQISNLIKTVILFFDPIIKNILNVKVEISLLYGDISTFVVKGYNVLHRNANWLTLVDAIFVPYGPALFYVQNRI